MRTLNLAKKILFQFPSNGKAYPKQEMAQLNNETRSFVSIPFKRESISKEQNPDHFQNGVFVSIPFKRESISKVIFDLVKGEIC